jgi:hypothetical protein
LISAVSFITSGIVMLVAQPMAWNLVPFALVPRLWV